MKLDVLYSDNHLLAVNKPPGLLTQPGEFDGENLEAMAKAWIKRTLNKPGGVYLHAVHRLDRPASGVVLFARTEKALSRLNEEIRAGRATKIYHALIDQKPPQTEGALEHYLAHSSHHAKVVPPSDPGAKRARLQYRVLGPHGHGLLLEISLDTGRYHQIRAQWAAVGRPLVGDQKYGSRTPFPGGHIALHHRRMEIAHPVKKETMVFEAPYPPGSGWPS